MRRIFRIFLRAFTDGSALSALFIMTAVFFMEFVYQVPEYLYEPNPTVAFFEMLWTIAAIVVISWSLISYVRQERRRRQRLKKIVQKTEIEEDSP